VKDAIQLVFPSIEVEEKSASPDKFEIILEEDEKEIVIFSGLQRYKDSGNLKDKYPTGREVAQLLWNHFNSSKNIKTEQEDLNEVSN